jgi:HSP20 family protein
MRRNPVLEELQRIQERVDALFDRATPLGETEDALEMGSTAGGFVPAVDLSETATAFELAVELPGTTLDAIHLEASGTTVVLTGDRKPEGESGTYRSMERAFGPFRRSLDLPGPVDASAIVTRYERGVFFATLPKLASPGGS